MSPENERAEAKSEAATAKHLAEQCAELRRALRESEARQRLVEDQAQAVWETDAAGVVVTDSPSWRAYTGQTLEEWLGSGWLDAIHPDDKAYAERQWREAVARRGLVNAEFRLRAPDGGWRWTNVRAAPLLDEAGDVDKLVGINIDIHDRKIAESALQESEKRYRTVFDSIDEGFVEMEMIMGDAGQVIDWRWTAFNPAFERMSGLTGKKGQLFSEIVPELEPEWAERYGHVIATGETLRFELPVGGLDSWFDAFVSRIGEDGSRRLVVVFNDITARKKAEAALRESEERQAYLLKLSDAVAPLADSVDVQNAAMRVLGHHLGAFRAQYFEAEADGENVNSMAGYSDPPETFVTSRIRMDDFGSFVAADFRAGKTVVVADTAADPRMNEADRRSYQAWGMGAYVAVPLVKDGRFVVCVGVHSGVPRTWTDAEISLIQETAERTWGAVERARAETALRASEERFAQFAKASSAGIWIRDAATLAMEYVSPAISAIYGVATDAFPGDMETWAAMIVPEDRATALEYIELARQGESVVHEFRIQRPSDGTFRWIRNTDFPLDMNGRVQRVGGLTEDITEQKLNVEHQAVLLAELQHRVRNIMAIIRSIVARTAEGATSVADYADLVSGRLLALARVQALLTRSTGAKVGLAGLVRDELGALATSDAQFDVDGPDVELSPKAAETMTLAVHELTTNALKYGALASRDGIVTARWEVVDRRGTPWLVFRWVEAGAPQRPTAPGPRRVGFGSELIEGRIPYELRGRGKVTIEASGARCDLEFPLRSGASVLETDAPKQATVFGGAIDMSGQPDLSDQRVLVLEDDYYIATDTARALRGAGAEVIGPCATEDDARETITDAAPTCAVMDINLGAGPSFEVARELMADGVPIVFITGYDQDVIPADLTDVRRLQKPVQFREIVAALASVIRVQS